MKRAVVFFLVSFVLGGCLSESPEELDRLVKEDPAFKQMIAARDQAHRDIHLIKQDLLSRKKVLDAQFGKMRSEYDAYAKSQSKKIDQYRSIMEAYRDQLKKEIKLAQASMEDKQTELSGYQKTLADVNKVLTEGKGISLSKAERQKWEERVLMLSEKTRPLSEEIQELRLQIRLKKQKTGFLK
jgi:23S rRNA G2069 N7-methylase RlmK/C1962 C5-methylase RlmI